MNLTIERIIELEEELKNYNLESNLNYDELMYINRARKIPFNIMVIVIKYYKKRWYIIDEVEFENKIQNLFHVTKEELKLRFKDVNLILRYKNKQMNNLLLEQKKMIKKIKNNY